MALPEKRIDPIPAMRMPVRYRPRCSVLEKKDMPLL
jgi:hypothetical protein